MSIVGLFLIIWRESSKQTQRYWRILSVYVGFYYLSVVFGFFIWELKPIIFLKMRVSSVEHRFVVKFGLLTFWFEVSELNSILILGFFLKFIDVSLKMEKVSVIELFYNKWSWNLLCSVNLPIHSLYTMLYFIFFHR